MRITHKHLDLIFVTEIEQYAVPACVYVQDLYASITESCNYFQLDFHGVYEDRQWGHGKEPSDVKDMMVNKLVDWLKELGVIILGQR